MAIIKENYHRELKNLSFQWIRYNHRRYCLTLRIRVKKKKKDVIFAIQQLNITSKSLFDYIFKRFFFLSPQNCMNMKYFRLSDAIVNYEIF